jgi:undecaprenyl-diphosphatase
LHPVERRSPFASRRRSRALTVLLVALALGVLIGPRATAAVATDTTAVEQPDGTGGGMSTLDAVILGLVEGITEYLPISSTGHLTVTQDLLGIGTDSPREKEAADAYAVVIQAGAILAVVVLYWRRLMSLLAGLVGRDEDGRRVLIGLVIAVAPIAVIGTVSESRIKDLLFGVGPVIFAWVVGGVVILVLSYRGWWGADPTAGDGDGDGEGDRPGRAAEDRTAGFAQPAGPAPGTGRRVRGRAPLEMITVRQAAVIGAAQVLALWPGTSRSLVTIVAALAVGLSMAAAVEFSFLLGLVVLSAATLYDAVKHGDVIVETFGWFNPAVGFVVAFGAAVVAVRWMVGYLQRHSLAIFGWYRLAVAALVGFLWARGSV